ncbi:MAG: TIGR02281 family clan AA aspartic protease [Pseudomonadota bacterium]
MPGDTTAYAFYLILLLAYLAYFFLRGNRLSGGKMVQQTVIWILIFVGIIAAYGLWEDLKPSVENESALVTASGDIEIPRSPGGHYHVTLEVNGEPVRFIVDTGATDIVLTMEDAERIGIDTDRVPFLGQARTANGTVPTALVRLDSVALGPVLDTRVPARISAGEMPGSLLGMNYLRRFETITISGDRMTLSR